MQAKRMPLAFVVVLATALDLYAAALPEQAVRTRRFEITVAPRDARSNDARAADLFITRAVGSGWRLSGPCRVEHTAAGPQFSRWIDVPADGIYYIRARAGDEAGKPQPPGVTDPPDVKVIVDTRCPVVTLGRPQGDEEHRAGDVLPIAWTAADDNFAADPIRLDYSLDGGRTWRPICDATENDGKENWIVPATDAKTLLVRLTATDRAGNATVAAIARPVRLLPVSDEAEAPPAAAKKRKFLWMDANDADVTPQQWESYSPDYDAYTNYVIAGNLARQGKLKDSLRYYNAAVEKDEKFCDAWNDLALVYKQLGTFDKAYRCIHEALALQPKNHVYNHTAGEVFQAKSMHLFRHALGDQDAAKAVQAVHMALKYYNRAIEEAEKQGRLAEIGGTFFRLGEICYYINQDPLGARMYWRKVISLHTPTPNLDDVMYRQGTPEEEKARAVYERYTEMKVRLETWQRWARAYLDQLNEMERQGLLQPAPHGGELSEEELRSQPPAVMPKHKEEPSRPEGAGPYYRRDYGSWPEAGHVQRDIPPPPAPRQKSPSRQFHEFDQDEALPPPTSHYAHPDYGSDPGDGAPASMPELKGSGEYRSYGKYGRGTGARSTDSRPAAPDAGNQYWDYGRFR